MNEDLKLVRDIVVITIVILTLIFVPIFSFGFFWEYNICQTRISLSPEYTYKWVLFGGCLVETPSGYWVHHSDNIKVIDGQLILDSE